ncbi:MAG TPA: 3-hydroxybutyrate dehydrogenase [Acidimicrobiales bacterium]|nr:3-hydroxybutyrate dehydrogenase [Acidimicrobiales bacterium]
MASTTVEGRPLEGRRALVTGAASGIGRACAEKLHELGAAVVAADRDAEGAGALALALGCEVWVVDLADSARLAGERLEVDILVNNAGFQHVAPVEDFEPEIFREMLAVMLEAPFLLARAAVPHMYAKGWGRVVNVSSVHGLRASPYKSAYVAAKHGLEGLSKVLALEGADHGVTSNTVCPGYVRTPLVEKQIASQARLHAVDEAEVVQTVLLRESAVKRLVEPWEVASVVAYLCGPGSGFITGTSVVMDGGWTAR